MHHSTIYGKSSKDYNLSIILPIILIIRFKFIMYFILVLIKVRNGLRPTRLQVKLRASPEQNQASFDLDI